MAIIRDGIFGGNLFGTNAADQIDAGAGNDSIHSAGGDDVINAGWGDDFVSAGADDDQVYGDKGDDLLGGDGGDDYLDGGEGADEMYGGGDNDYMVGGVGNDELNGGTGIDTASFDSDVANVGSVSVVLGHDGSTSFAYLGDGSFDTLTQIENVVGSRYADHITGNNIANALYGGDGNDVLIGLGGGDYIDGGSGNDRVDYSASATGVILDLSDTAMEHGGDAEGDVLISIEDVDGTHFNDFIVAGTRGTLNGLEGDDFFIASSGTNYINGGEGIDTVSYERSSAGVTADLAFGSRLISAGDANGDMIGNVENLVGSTFNDNLTGSFFDNVISGGAGVDTISAEQGNDRLMGGLGRDVLSGGAGQDVFAYTAATEMLVATNPFTGQLLLERITDFEIGSDKIDFAKIDANTQVASTQAFVEVDFFTGQAGQLVIGPSLTEAGTFTVLGDTNGDGVADIGLSVHLTTTGTLGLSDFQF